MGDAMTGASPAPAPQGDRLPVAHARKVMTERDPAPPEAVLAPLEPLLAGSGTARSEYGAGSSNDR